jgi:hypothetical protein
MTSTQPDSSDPEAVDAARHAANTAASEVRNTAPNCGLVITSVCNQINQINSKISSFLNTLSTFNSRVEKITVVCTVLCHMNLPRISLFVDQPLCSSGMVNPLICLRGIVVMFHCLCYNLTCG